MPTTTTKKGRAAPAARPFESEYSLSKVTASQWLVEQICQRESTAAGGGRLPPHFWRAARWAAHFRNQMAALRAAVKTAAEAAAVSVAAAERAAVVAFNHPELGWVRSFRTPTFLRALRAACAAARNAPLPATPVPSAPSAPSAPPAPPVAPPSPAAGGPPPAPPPSAGAATRAGRFKMLDDD